MERTGQQIQGRSPRTPRAARRLRTALLLLGGAVALGGCYVAPYAYAPGPAYVVPAPVYRWHGHGWHGHRWHGHGWHGHGWHGHGHR
jgi:hypothetical protein